MDGPSPWIQISQTLVSNQKWAVLIARVLIALAFLRILFGTSVGLFALSLIAYFLVGHATTVEPFSFRQLVLWFDGIEGGTRTAIIAAFIAGLGLYVSASLAMRSWFKQQRIAALRADARSITETIKPFESAILRLSTLAYVGLEFVRECEEYADAEDIRAGAMVFVSESRKRAADREFLRDHAPETQLMEATYWTSLIADPMLFGNLRRTAECINRAASSTYVSLPGVDFEVPENAADLYAQIDKHRLQIMHKECSEMSRAIGALKGQIGSKAGGILWGVGLSGFEMFWMGRNMLKEAKRIGDEMEAETLDHDGQS